MSPAPADFLARAAPPLFVVIWATGFVVARLVAPHADPLAFLTLRFGLAALVLAAVAALAGARWPVTAKGWRDGLIAGVLLHGAYLGGVFWAVKHGLPAGISALVAGLQPLATGMLVGPLLGEPVSRRRWLGILTGFAGALLVVAPKLGVAGGLPALPLGICLLGMLSITVGTIWQKRTAASVDLRTNAVLQYLGAAAFTLPIALLWTVFAMSIGAVGLLLVLIRRGAVAKVAALLYLVPPVAAVLAFWLFGEALTPVQIVGMALAAVGVAIASRG